jgi:hypothetical protein
MNASNSRNENDNRTANTVGTPTTAGMLAKVVRPATACRVANNNMTPLTPEMTAEAAEKPAIFSREASNIRDANNITSISRNLTAIVWSPATDEFSEKFAKDLSVCYSGSVFS